VYLASTKFNLPQIRVPVVVLIGPPGAGKTTIGGALAKRLGCPFFDTDAVIESATGLSAAKIIREHGEPVFRELEKCLIAEFVTKAKDSAMAAAAGNKKAPDRPGTVVSTGAGLPVQPGNLEELENLGKVICLTAPLEVLAHRVSLSGGRVMLQIASHEAPGASSSQENTVERLRRLLSVRTPFYARAKAQISVENSDIDEIVERILKSLANCD
jgi:shikimate kinase